MANVSFQVLSLKDTAAGFVEVSEAEAEWFGVYEMVDGILHLEDVFDIRDEAEAHAAERTGERVWA